jgi:hypothetical protein
VRFCFSRSLWACLIRRLAEADQVRTTTITYMLTRFSWALTAIFLLPLAACFYLLPRYQRQKPFNQPSPVTMISSRIPVHFISHGKPLPPPYALSLTEARSVFYYPFFPFIRSALAYSFATYVRQVDHPPCSTPPRPATAPGPRPVNPSSPTPPKPSSLSPLIGKTPNTPPPFSVSSSSRSFSSPVSVLPLYLSGAHPTPPCFRSRFTR